MFKIILMILVALAAALYFPQSRSVVVEYAGPLLNPAFRMATSAEMEKISRDLQTYERETGRLPEPRAFGTWLEGRYAGDVTRDSWGNTYILVVRNRAFDVVSMGPDGRQGTSDDIVETRNRR
jgi:hypothetical protein